MEWHLSGYHDARQHFPTKGLMHRTFLCRSAATLSHVTLGSLRRCNALRRFVELGPVTERSGHSAPSALGCDHSAARAAGPGFSLRETFDLMNSACRPGQSRRSGIGVVKTHPGRDSGPQPSLKSLKNCHLQKFRPWRFLDFA
jgi:hypothetical protein